MIHEPDLRFFLPSWAFDLLALVIGLAVGSFANVCIHRIPLRESVVRPPSRCPACGGLIRSFDNVPVLSWLWLRGRCRGCRAAISPRYPLVEAANGLLYLGLAVVGGLSTWTLVAMPLATALLVLAIIDLDVQLLPDVITLPGIGLGIAASFLHPAWPVGPWESVGAAAGGYGALALVARAYQKTRGQEGLGQGDWKMTAFLGAFLGWQKMLLVVLLASLGGTAVGVAAMALGRGDMKSKLPLGTFLSAAGIAVLFGGDRLLVWYSGLFRG
jgi:leader peptidase (prepilin peptidase) / N-methyltransferase